MKKDKMLVIGVLLLLATAMSACAGKAAPVESTAAQTTAVTEMTEMTEVTEPEIRYEKQTVRLCTGYVTTQTDGSGSRGYAFDYDEYGRVTYYSLYFDGVLSSYRNYYYDDAEEKAYVEYYDEKGNLKKTESTLITGPEIEIGGMPENRHGTYVYNDEGYIIEETINSGTVLYRREYNDDYTEMTEIGYPDNESKRFLSRTATLDEAGKLLTEVVYTEDGEVSVSKVYTYDEQGRVVRIDNDIPGGYMPLNYPWHYVYDEYGDLVLFDVDYYYGYETVYTYESYEVWMPVTE